MRDSANLKLARTQCPIARTLQIVGQKWTLLIMREALYGVSRFEDFQANLNIPRPVLSDRLTLLTNQGLLVRRPYNRKGQRVRYDYHLTEKGTDLLPVLISMMQWGDKYLMESVEPAIVLSHNKCDSQVRLELICASDRHIVSVNELSIEVKAKKESLP
jgi:DNA-binding HxlR family transcriptional regulator